MPTDRLKGDCPGLLVRDVVASLAFYRDKLGFRVLSVHGDPPELATLRRSECHIVLKRGGASPEDRRRQYADCDWLDDTLFRAAEPGDVDAFHQEFVAAGVSIASPPHTDENDVRAFSFLDLDGYKFWIIG